MDSGLQQFGEAIAAALPGAIAGISTDYGELSLTVESTRLVETVTYLRDDPSCLFVSFIDLTAVDYPARDKRFDVVTHLLSPKHNRRIRLKVAAGEAELVPSLTGLYPAANWFEREAYDLFGVVFAGHPDLRRLLTDYGFDGHPLRKDFPMTGYVEVRYDDEQKRVVYEPVKLTQEFRSFDFLSPWEGEIGYVLPGDEKAKDIPH
ncbi:MAG: NADH-quinone oxidoreductase subunit C [Beijerinckiaceae bacterium]|nr:NADH-quinone oxidoreductase subunit C [Beijerinckiaceae bacterium]MCI0736744.1 NADH-quinone oxidoreductase subunit C [Beijerinckiaceae bacterium]